MTRWLLHATTPCCEDLEQRRKFGGTFAFGCHPSLGLPGYTGTVECTDDSDNIAFACVGQLQGKGCVSAINSTCTLGDASGDRHDI